MSLVAHWKLDEQTGTSIADGAGSNSGTWVGTGSQALTSVSAPNGTGLLFDGVGDYVEVPDSALWDDTQITISAWIKPESDHTGHICTRRTTASSLWQFYYDPNNLIVCAGASTTLTGTNNSVPINEWAFVTAVFRPSTGNCELYVNAKLNASGDIPDVGTGAIKPLIGARWDVEDTSIAFPFDGPIDDVRIYDAALNSDEILKLYNDSRGILNPIKYITLLK